MAKKFGKFILFTAAAAAACAGVYYYMKSKEEIGLDDGFDDEDEDYDDFAEDLDDEQTRNYVPLNYDSVPVENTDEEAPFEKLSSLVSESEQKTDETVEEFFDEDDITE